MFNGLCFCVFCIAIQFQICIQNRYKLNKKYRKLLSAYGDEVDSLESKSIKAQAKVSRLLRYNDIAVPHHSREVTQWMNE